MRAFGVVLFAAFSLMWSCSAQIKKPSPPTMLLAEQMMTDDYTPPELTNEELSALKERDYQAWVTYHLLMLGSDNWHLRQKSTAILMKEPVDILSPLLPQKASPERMSRIEAIRKHEIPAKNESYFFMR